jgi:hypothetical protein
MKTPIRGLIVVVLAAILVASCLFFSLPHKWQVGDVGLTNEVHLVNSANYSSDPVWYRGREFSNCRLPVGEVTVLEVSGNGYLLLQSLVTACKGWLPAGRLREQPAP